jgi:hypothetical protein
MSSTTDHCTSCRRLVGEDYLTRRVDGRFVPRYLCDACVVVEELASEQLVADADALDAAIGVGL